jgi:hypothetical protein
LDIEDLVQDNDTEHMLLIITAKKLKDRANMNKRPATMVGRVCIP